MEWVSSEDSSLQLIEKPYSPDAQQNFTSPVDSNTSSVIFNISNILKKKQKQNRRISWVKSFKGSVVDQVVQRLMTSTCDVVL